MTTAFEAADVFELKTPIVVVGAVRNLGSAVAVTGTTVCDVPEEDRGVSPQLFVQETATPSMVATTMSVISLALMGPGLSPEEYGTTPEGAIGYTVPEYCANFSMMVTEPMGDVAVMNVDLLEFQPLGASPVYAPAADAVKMVSVWVSV